jgi:photosystem II stability/assembly factor-like uncharacterized protein
VAGVPGESTTFYFGGVDGGVWQTTDSGVVWKPISDGTPIASVGAIALAPSDPKVIYVGTGESDIRSSLSSGDGVYRSDDAGRTWKHVGLEDTHQISRIVVDPKNANVVYVGALGHVYGPNHERGVYKSTDGGEHWTKVLDQGPETGVSDLAICANNPNLLFAGTWHTWRPPWSVYAPIDGPGGALFQSQDAGKTWTRLNGRGLPDGDWGRIGVDVAADGNRVYALIQAKKAGLYRSDDGGENWNLVNDDPRLTSRAWYFNRITIDPSNSDVLYVPNVALYRSEDGGKTISIVRGAPGGDDYHQIWVDPKDSSRMVLGTDQGTTISLDRGKTWSTWYNQPTAQLYNVTTDNQYPYAVYGTQQDSGSIAVYSRGSWGRIGPTDWFPAGPSESGHMVVDSTDPNIIYLTAGYGGVERFNRRTTLSQDVSPWPVSLFGSEIHQHKYRAPWTPVLVAIPREPHALLLGTQYVMKTSDGGLHWQTISPDLTGSSMKNTGAQAEKPPTLADAKQSGFGVISSLAPSPLDRGLIWAGTNTGLIHLTTDGGKTWKNATPRGLTDWSAVSAIEASRFDAAVAYAAVNRSRLDDQKPYLYRTRDYGATWQLLTNGIPNTAFLRVVREDPQMKNLLFAGTELGVYVSFDDGDHWQSLELNLPTSSVRDLTVHGDDLVAATHGRSFWILDDITPLRQRADAQGAGTAWLYRPAPAIRVDTDGFVGTPLPPEEPTAENPPNGAIIDYFLKSPAKQVKLEIYDSHENLVRTFKSEDQSSTKHDKVPIAERWFPKPQILETSSGMHRFVWDLRWRSSGGPIPDDEDSQIPSGPKAVPGRYQVRITVDGLIQNQPLQVVMDPRSPATPEVLAQHLEVAKKIFAESMEARRALAEMNAVEKQVGDAERQLPEQDAEARSALTEAQAQIKGILTTGGSTLPGNKGMENAYADLLSELHAVESGDRSVPSQAIDAYDSTSPQIEARVREWAAFKQSKLEELNRRLRAAGQSAITISQIEWEIGDLMTR